MHDAVVFKIARRAQWAEAEAAGRFAGSPVDLEDGYIHLSTAAQVAETARRYYAGMDDLVIVAVRTAPFGTAMMWEPSRGGDLFPHLYAPLDLAHVAWVKPLPLDADGRHLFPPLVEDPAA